MTESKNKPFIIPVFLPNVGCPHQCAFCNQTAITGEKQKIISIEKLGSYINEFLDYKGLQRKRVQIAFYGGNFLGLKGDYINSLLQEASKFVNQGKVDSIRFSTRPDTIDNERLDLLKEFPVATIELGVQSMDDNVLAMSRRGHTSLDTEKAVCLLKKRDYEIGLQMMVGLPGDDEAGALASGCRIAELYPDFVRIYPTLVLDKSPLAGWYRKGRYTPLSLQQCVTLVKRLYLLFREKGINVIRMGLQASESLESKKDLHDMISIRVNPKNISKMRGLKNRNIEILKTKFHIRSVEIVPDMTLAENMLVIEDMVTVKPLRHKGSKEGYD
jgi:histone acetyltransferase (RNA polymerase elongator complex component)